MRNQFVDDGCGQMEIQCQYPCHDKDVRCTPKSGYLIRVHSFSCYKQNVLVLPLIMNSYNDSLNILRSKQCFAIQCCDLVIIIEEVEQVLRYKKYLMSCVNLLGTVSCHAVSKFTIDKEK